MGRTSDIPKELEAEMTPAVRAFVESLLKRIEQLEKVIRTPRNSSLPPSSEHPHAKPAAKQPKSKRKRGGQPGHAKCERPLLPSDKCDDVQTVKPKECRRCGTKLVGSDSDPLRHQVYELPRIKPLVTEYRRHRLTCSCCGEQTCATLPSGVPVGQSGPRLIAFSALLMAYFRQSKRRTAEFLQTLLGQPCSTGLTVKHQKLAGAALASAYDELVGQLPRQEQLGIDETPTKEASRKAWLWTFVARNFTVFGIRLSRSAAILRELLTSEFRGTINCDRAKMYWSLGLEPAPDPPTHRLQWCWAHLKRDFQALIDSPDRQVKRLGHDLMRPTKELFTVWARCRDGTITRRGFERLMKPIRIEINGLLLRGVCSGNRHLVGMCNELFDHRDWLWTFVDSEGSKPTNNASERSLRHAVIWRKLSFGTQSAAGSRFTERLLTVIETCRQQARNTFDYLTQALEAKFQNKPCPSLLTTL